MATAVLHIGFTKTGSTTLQRFLSDTRDLLLGRKVVYPRCLTFGGEQHIALSMMFMGFRAVRPFGPRLVEDLDSPGKVAELERRSVAALRAELALLDHDTVVFSDEGLSGLKDYAELARLRNFLGQFGFERIEVVAYLRRPDSHSIADMTQRVFSGEHIDGTALHFPHLQDEIHWFYDYHARLARWDRMFGAGTLTLRIYEDYRESPNGILEDFLDGIGVLDLFEPIVMDRLNVSAAGDLMVMLNQVNRRILATPGIGYGDAFAFCRQVRSDHDGPGERFRIGSDAARLFNGLFEPSFLMLAERYFPERATLFPPVEEAVATRVDFASPEVVERVNSLWEDWSLWQDRLARRRSTPG